MGGALGEARRVLAGTKVKGQAATTIPLGCAALILAYPRSSAAQLEPAVRRAITKATDEATGHHVQAFRNALAGAQQQLATTQP